MCAAVVLLAVGLAGLLGSLAWVGKTFPGFLLLENRVVASAGLPGWPAVRGGDIYQSELVAVEGAPLQSAEELRARVEPLPPGTPLTYRFRRGDREWEQVVPTRRFERRDFALLFGIYLLNGSVLGGTALAIRRLRQAHAAQSAIPVLLLGALWGLSATDLYGPYRMFRLHALCEALLPAAALHMALGFPLPAALARRCPGLVRGAYAASALFGLAYQIGLRDPRAYVAAHLLATSALGLALLALIGSQLVRWIRTKAPEVRRQSRLLALSALVALAPAVLLTIAEPITGGQASQNAVGFTAFLFPLTIAYAILRHGLLAARVARGNGE